MNQTEFSKAIDALGLTQVSAARFLGVDPRTCRRQAFAVVREASAICKMIDHFRITERH
jgi:hypothetical protein